MCIVKNSLYDWKTGIDSSVFACVYIYIYIYIYINTNTFLNTSHVYIYIRSPTRGLSTLANELMAATHVMQSSSNELSPLVSGKAKCKQTKAIT